MEEIANTDGAKALYPIPILTTAALPPVKNPPDIKVQKGGYYALTLKQFRS